MLKKIALIVGLFVIAVLVFNQSWFVPARDQSISILAHRGVYQNFHREGLTNQTCTAERIFPPTHNYLENTIPGVEAAFNLGADMVEIDVLPTADAKFVVFHDWMLDCRTDGTGPTHEATLAELQSLDIGYGYTADNGQTYPFRGLGTGMMPSLAELLSAFPNYHFMINLKRNRAGDADDLKDYLEDNAVSISNESILWSGARFVERWRSIQPEVKVTSRREVKACAKNYLAFGWTGRVPASCLSFGLVVPQDIDWLYWGWPEKTVNRLENRQSRVFIAAALGSDQQGIDSEQQLAEIPAGFRGWIVTDRIEIVGPLVKSIDSAECSVSRFGAQQGHQQICGKQ